MEHLNPYDPTVAASETNGSSSDSIGTITSRFTFTSDHLSDSLARYRSQHKGRRIWRWFRYFAAFLFLIVAIFGLFVPQYFASAFMVALTIFMFFPHKIDDLLARSRFRKSPEYGAQQVVHLSQVGFQAKSEIEETSLKWTAFSKAVIFDDGVLLFRGSNTVNWIADATLECDDDKLRIRDLVSGNVPTNHAIQRSKA
ncbi:hypothetical protein Rcae01_05590 [Novipirellula caenicola]|uniref:YcxB-like protein domain-containing protein n=1 Tax=Novipirellula caenicola TaxID=1536901 RepID=A0ABP9VY65_9BACT